jgi:GNAT superfamily N-acetyltransferase
MTTDPYALAIEEAEPWIETRDGRRLTARLIRSDDAPLLIDLFERLSSETRRRRFHADVDHLDEASKRRHAQRLVDVDNRTDGGAVLALDSDTAGNEFIVGVARLMRPEGQPDHPEAEAAIVVRDDYQGQGIGTQLLRRMVLLAIRMNVRTILAEIEANNYPALRLFRELGLPTETQTSRAETIMLIQVPG